MAPGGHRQGHQIDGKRQAALEPIQPKLGDRMYLFDHGCDYQSDSRPTKQNGNCPTGVRLQHLHDHSSKQKTLEGCQTEALVGGQTQFMSTAMETSDDSFPDTQASQHISDWSDRVDGSQLINKRFEVAEKKRLATNLDLSQFLLFPLFSRFLHGSINDAQKRMGESRDGNGV